MNGGGEADFAEQSAEQTNKGNVLAVSEAKRGKPTDGSGIFYKGKGGE